MRKIEIIEIENSFLNFFTPAVLVPVSYFLFNLIGWPSLFFRYLISQSGIETDLNLVHSFFSVVFMVLTCSILYYILIYLPRLKVHDSEYKKPSKLGFWIVGVFLCIILLFNGVIIGIYEYFFGSFEIQLNSLFPLSLLKQDTFYFLVFLVYDIILFTLLFQSSKRVNFVAQFCGLFKFQCFCGFHHAFLQLFDQLLTFHWGHLFPYLMPA